MAGFRFTHHPQALAEAAGLDLADERVARLVALLVERDRELEDYLDANT